MLYFYVGLLVAGVLMIGAEIYLPGGILGFLGGMALLGAAGVGFLAFGASGGVLSAVGILLLSAACLYFWLRFFPKTGVGRSLTLSRDISEFSSSPDMGALVGQEGRALSELRPGGIVEIDGRRVDVVADGSWISRDARIRVERVEGFRVLVRELEKTAEAP